MSLKLLPNGVIEAPRHKQDEEIYMTIAHWCLGTSASGRSGMYETVKELILAEMEIPGVMAGLVNPENPAGGRSDGYVTEMPHQWAHEHATIHVSSYFMTGYATMQRPRVQLIHGCFFREQRITMADGKRKRITDIQIGELVPSRNPTTGLIENKPVTWVGPNGRSESWLRIDAQFGPKLVCTPDHPLYLMDGTKIRAEEAKEGTELFGMKPKLTPLQHTIHYESIPNKVLSVKPWKQRQSEWGKKKSGKKRLYGYTRWALTIADNHNYFAGYCLVGNTQEACYEAEKESGAFTAVVGGLQNLDASIVMNKRQYAFWKSYDHRNTLNYVDKGVDLTRYTPKGMRIELDGEPAIGLGEVQRGIKQPLIPYWAINEYYKVNEKARLHHWGISDERKILEIMIHKGNFDKFLGKYGLMGWQAFPENWYRGLDMLLSPSLYGDPSRVAFEAMSCGLPVIDFDSSSRWNDTFANVHSQSLDPISMSECIASLYDDIRANKQKVREETRKIAEQHYDIRNTAKQIVAILRKVQDEVGSK